MNRWKPTVTFKPAVAKPVNTRPRTYINVSVKNGKFASNANAANKRAYNAYWSTTSLMPTPNGKGTVNPLAKSPTNVNTTQNTNAADKLAYDTYWSTTSLMPTPNGKGTVNPLAKSRTNTDAANKLAYNKYWSTTYLTPTPNGRGTVNPLAKRRKTRKLSTRKNRH